MPSSQKENLEVVQKIIKDFEEKFPGKEDEILNAVIHCLVKHSTASQEELIEDIKECLSWVHQIR